MIFQYLISEPEFLYILVSHLFFQTTIITKKILISERIYDSFLKQNFFSKNIFERIMFFDKCHT